MTKSSIKKQQRLARGSKLKAMNRFDHDKVSVLYFKSNKHIYAQLIKAGKVLAGFNTLQESLSNLSSKEAAVKIGSLIADKASELQINSAYLDRNGFQYHGLIKLMCDECRNKGLIE